MAAIHIFLHSHSELSIPQIKISASIFHIITQIEYTEEPTVAYKDDWMDLQNIISVF